MIQLCVILLGLLMFTLKPEQKLAVLIFTCLCLNAVTISFIPHGSAINYMSYCFLLSEFSNMVSVLKQTKVRQLYALFVIIIIATVVLLANSPHYQSAIGIVKMVITELIGKYFAFFYALYSVSDMDCIKPFVRATVIGVALLTFFGVLNYFEHETLWLDLVMPNGATVEHQDFLIAERFRVQSMFDNPFNYGFVSCLAMLVLWYAYRKEIIIKPLFLIMIICSLFGVYTCGSRTVMVIFFISLAVFSFLLLPRQKIKQLAIGILVAVFVIIFFGLIPEDTIDLFMQAFDTDTNLTGNSGSSIGMRILQFGAVLYQIQGHYLFGNGKDYFLIDLGWGDGGLEAVMDQDLYGLEGVYLNLLLERGIVGLLFWVVIYAIIVHYIYKHRNAFETEYALGMSVFTLYFVFACSTGELSSVYPTLLVLGAIAGLIMNETKEPEAETDTDTESELVAEK